MIHWHSDSFTAMLNVKCIAWPTNFNNSLCWRWVTDLLLLLSPFPSLSAARAGKEARLEDLLLEEIKIIVPLLVVPDKEVTPLVTPRYGSVTPPALSWSFYISLCSLWSLACLPRAYGLAKNGRRVKGIYFPLLSSLCMRILVQPT